MGFSHGLVNHCWYQGRYTLGFKDINTTLTVRITLFDFTGSFDSTFVVSNNNQTFTVPQSNILSPVHVSASFSDGVVTDIWTNSISCSPLALKEVIVKSNIKQDGSLEVWITVDDDSNIKEYRITNRVSGKVYKILIPDNRVGRKTYYLILK
jgi:hypothetical protein